MRATVFRIHSLETGAPVGWGLLCPDARYASVKSTGTAALARRHGDATDWRDVLHEMAMGLPPGPLPAKGAVSRLLAGDRPDLVVQYVTVVHVKEALGAASALDEILNGYN